MKQWQGISELVAIADLGTFTAAADSLKISIAQVSRNISELEQRLNIKLLHRSTRKVSLTEEGKLYLIHCRNLVEGLNEANQTLSSLTSTPQGRLKITAPVFFGESQLAPLLHEFLLRYRGVSLDLELTNARLDLIQGGFDLAIRIGTLESSSLIARRLGNRKQSIVGSPAYLKAHGQPEVPSALNKYECLIGSLGHWRLTNAQGQAITFKPKGRIHCNSGPALLDAALKGLGLVQLPDYYVQQHIQQQSLIPILEQFKAEDDGIWAVYPENRHLSAKVKVLVDFLAQRGFGH